MIDAEKAEGASLIGLQDECLALILRVIAGAEDGEPAPAKHERSRRLLSWRSLLLTSQRVRSIALSPEFPVWHVLNYERLEAFQPEGSAVADATSVLQDALRASCRCGHLRSLDLSCLQTTSPSSRESEGNAQGACADEQASLIRQHCTALESIRLAGQISAAHIELLPSLDRLNSLVFSGECGISDSQLMVLEPGCLPQLERLSLAGCSHIVGQCFRPLLAAAPGMTHMNVACGRVKRWNFVFFANTGRAIAVHALYTDRPLLFSEAAQSGQEEDEEGDGHEAGGIGGVGHECGGLRRESVPVPLRVTCGRCGIVIWERLASYVLVGGQQPHIHSEIWTHEPPDLSALAHHADEAALPTSGCRRFLCRNHCHAQRGSMWLVDRTSGMIDTAGFTWGIACGAGSPQTGGVPLGFYTGVAPSTEELKRRQAYTNTPYGDWCPA